MFNHIYVFLYCSSPFITILFKEMANMELNSPPGGGTGLGWEQFAAFPQSAARMAQTQSDAKVC